MSKLNIPVCKLNDDECNTLLSSVVEKLKIENPQFYSPIYKKILDENQEPTNNIIFDSKFKCKQILNKIVDDDSDEYITDNEEDENENENNNDNEEVNNSKPKLITDENNQSNNITEINTQEDLDNILNNDADLDLEGKLAEESDPEIAESDREFEEAVQNTYLATALIERVNKNTGEKIIKEEQIHIKKTPLLEPLKVMKDEFVIPARIQNKNLNDQTLKDTMNKINSYNNSGHVESLFLYLGNKLVESGKCPSFPYYYGCVNGDDPNYHHNITDEYDMVSRTKWFRQRVKNDFDLIIVEGDEVDETREEMENNFKLSPNSKLPMLLKKQREANGDGEDGTFDIEALKKYFEGNESDTDEASENEASDNESNEDELIENESEIDKADEEIDITNGNVSIIKLNDATESSTETDNQITVGNEKQPTTLSIDDLGSTLDDILDEINNKTATGNCKDTSFITDLADENLDIDLNENENDNDNQDNTENDNNNENTNQTDNLESLLEQQKQNGGTGGTGDIDDDMFDELSDIDPDNLSMSDFDINNNNLYFIKCDKMPVSLCLMEKLDQTLDDILDDGYNMSENEWFSVFFQTAFGLAIAQKYFNFVHNDLHSSNIMFKATPAKYLFYKIGNQHYKIPTYGRVTKIIDFARGTFKLGDRWIFSDQFKEDGDACGQYDYPIDGSLENCEHKPNPSFDLVRLGTTVIHRLENLPNVREFVEAITRDDYSNSLCYEEDTFQLYIDIAHNCHNAVPIDVLVWSVFDRFKIAKEKIPKGVYVFGY